MKRNWYAVLLLLLLGCCVFAAGRYITQTTAAMQESLQAAYALAEQGNCPAAQTAYRQAAAQARRYSRVLLWFVRRNNIEQMNQTLAVLAPCAEPDSLADLEMETRRAEEQIKQIRQSFFGGF